MDNKATHKLFSHPEFLKETAEESPLRFQEQEIKRILQYINHHIEQQKSEIIAYLAPYGSGKSVILNNVLEKLPNSYHKIQFDIWQCANDADIWRNFLIKSLSKVKNKDENRIFDEIDGSKINNKQLIFFLAIYFALSMVTWFLLKDSTNWFFAFLKSFLIYAVPILLVLVGLNRFFPVYESPAKTLFQYEEKLKQELLHIKHATIIIIEDIDRSGESGKRFLETLKCFLSKIDKPILVICPQKNMSFGKSVMGTISDYPDATSKLENSIKIYDDVIYGNMPTKITKEQATQLLERVGCINEKLTNVVELLIGLSSEYSIFTMRSLKFLLRNIVSFMDAYPNADPALAFFFLSSNFLNSYESATTVPLVKSIIKPGISITANPNSSKPKLAIVLFEINPDILRRATLIQFKFSNIDNEKESKYHRHTKNKSWIVCEADMKYKELLDSISIN